MIPPMSPAGLCHPWAGSPAKSVAHLACWLGETRSPYLRSKLPMNLIGDGARDSSRFNAMRCMTWGAGSDVERESKPEAA